MKWTNEATGRTIEIYNEDCMPALEKMQENEFELAIVDPVYGDSIITGGYTSGRGGGVAKQHKYNQKLWSQKKTSKEYFDLLKMKTNNQIVWGGNYFVKEINENHGGWILWDKKNGEVSFSDGELAYTSFDRALRIFRYLWSGMLQEKMGKDKEKRITPTQKPVALYKWLLKNYAKENDRILDTHLGSGSIAIACWEMGFDLVGYELDKDYFDATCKRLNDHFRQGVLF